MNAEINHDEDTIYYSIEDLGIEIELKEKFATVEPCEFMDKASEEYWDANWERIEKEVMDYLESEKMLIIDLTNLEKIDFEKDQNLFSIRKNGKELLGYIEAKDGKLVTSGEIGENTYSNFVELIKGLQGHDIKIDDFYW